MTRGVIASLLRYSVIAIMVATRSGCHWFRSQQNKITHQTSEVKSGPARINVSRFSEKLCAITALQQNLLCIAFCFIVLCSIKTKEFSTINNSAQVHISFFINIHCVCEYSPMEFRVHGNMTQSKILWLNSVETKPAPMSPHLPPLVYSQINTSFSH